jgi:hypothetical protein
MIKMNHILNCAIVALFALCYNQNGLASDNQGPTVKNTIPDDSTGLHFVELSSIPGQYYNIGSNNRYAYLGSTNGLHIIDTENPMSLEQVCFIPCNGLSSMRVKDNYLFITYFNSFNIYDISDISNPIIVGSGGLDTPSITDICVKDNYVYLVVYWAIASFDISDPTHPQLISTIETPGEALKMEISGNFAFVADAFCVTAVDITNPAAMSVASVIYSSNPIDDIKIVGNYAFYTAGIDSLGLQVADITDPHNIRQVAGTAILGTGSTIDINGIYAFIGCDDDGIRAVNISNPLAPFLVASSIAYGRVFDVAAYSQYAYAGCFDSFKILLLTVSSSGIAGDANGDGTFNGLDVVYSVNYFKGMGPSPAPTFCRPPIGTIFKEADSNGNCAFNGIDITFSVNYLKGSPISPAICTDCIPLD